MPTNTNLTKIADQCVMCGMCLPHCPTYQVSQHEGESPRGRISLVKAYVEGSLHASTTLQAHLQSCTGCMKCQQICPANVPYQQIIDTGRQLYRDKLNLSAALLQSLSIFILTHQWGHRLVRLTSSVLKWLPIQSRFIHLLNLITKKKLDVTAASNAQQVITVLPGCTGSLFNQQTLDSIVDVLENLGVKANIPSQVMCCGALAQHSGLIDQAQKQIGAIKTYLAHQQVKQCISFASGCGRQLNQNFSGSNIDHYDILTWLQKFTPTNSLKLVPSAQRVLAHVPCTLDRSNKEYLFQLLNLIPGIQLLTLDDDLVCCGAGGMQLLTPEKSNNALLTSKVNTIRSIQPDIIVSSNIGCSLHFQLGLQAAGLDIEVIHPVTLLSRQLTQQSLNG